jgi:hypothetical protein
MWCAGGREGQQDEQPAAAGWNQGHGSEAEAAALEHGAREHQSYSKGTPINTNVQGTGTILPCVLGLGQCCCKCDCIHSVEET